MKPPGQGRHKSWGWGLIAFGVGISVLTYWQQYRTRINAEGNQTKLREQIGTLIRAELQSGLEDTRGLREDLRIGFQDLKSSIAAIGQTRTKQQQVKIPFPQLPPPAVSEFKFTERRTDSPSKEAPYGLQVVVQTSTSIQPTAFRIEFSGEISRIDFFVSGQPVIMNKRWRVDGNTAYISFGFPPFLPEYPLVLTVFSKTNIRVKRLDRLRE